MSASSFLGGVEPARRVLGGLNTSVGQVEERDVRGHCFPPVMTAALRHLLKFIRSFCLRFRVSYDGDPVYRAVADRAPAATVIIPPRATAVVSEVSAAGTPTPRDRHIEMIAAKGRLGWQKAVGYG